MNQLEYVNEINAAADYEKRAAARLGIERESLSVAEIAELTLQVQHWAIIEDYISRHGYMGARICLEFIYRNNTAMLADVNLYFQNGRSQT
jgi:hypothetical protein